MKKGMNHMKNLLLKNWDKILDFLKTEYNVSYPSYKTWLLPLQVYAVNDQCVTIAVDDNKVGSTNVDFIRNKYGLLLKTAIAETLNQDFDLKFVMLSELSVKKKNTPPITPAKSTSLLNPRYTFDNFVVSSNNNLAHAASLAVAEAPAEVYNPLYIYGGVGLGKTHLMHSIAQFIEQNYNYKVMYVQSEKFTNELIEAIRHGTNTPPEFREKYRNVDVLLIDDIQFIIGKERTQEEFFHTFNALYDAKKQIVISSDKPPKDLATLEERLLSRFEWGLIVDMQSPDFETRMAILKKKVELNNFSIDDELLKYIATNIKSNIRELEGSLTKIIALSRLQKREIDTALAEEALKDIISPNQKKAVTTDLIINVIAEHFEITTSELFSDNRSRNIAFPRQISMYLCRKLTSVSFSEVGKIMGNRDHSTILHGCNKIENDMKKDPALQNTIDILIKKINPQV